ncbi:MAG: hypothetical protein E6Q97_18710 [Desulfurellales bacterium]|nr:MAG: hypothetical protein E6Q97_18710 [Desulfurellales bacterium]
MKKRLNKIQRYLARSGVSLSSLARDAEVSDTTIRKVLSGDNEPTVQLARAIERGTKGQITAKEFMLCCMDGPMEVPDSRKKKRRGTSTAPSKQDSVHTV